MEAGPWFPAAATTTMPSCQATSAAYASGSIRYDWVLSVPKLRLRTRMFSPGSSRFITTQSMAARTWETSTAPLAPPTLTLTMWALGAMPRKSLLSPA